MSNYLLQVYQWVTDPQVWFGVGPFWQIIGVMLFTFTVLQLLPEDFAGGHLFAKQAMWITLILDALWVFMVFVAAFVPIGVVIALVIVVTLIVLAIVARSVWN